MYFARQQRKTTMVYQKKAVKISPHEKRVGEYVLKHGEMALGYHLCAHLNVFTMDTLCLNGVLKKEVKLASTGFVNNLWDEVPISA